MTRYMGGVLAVALITSLYGCAVTSPKTAPSPIPPGTPWTTKVSKPLQFTSPDEEKLRLPLSTDVGVAWDEISHRGQLRWDCRAVPSGKFVKNSLCADEPKIDSRWPGTAPPPGWDGMVHLD
jgi:hypothetical protein